MYRSGKGVLETLHAENVMGILERQLSRKKSYVMNCRQ